MAKITVYTHTADLDDFLDVIKNRHSTRKKPEFYLSLEHVNKLFRHSMVQVLIDLEEFDNLTYVSIMNSKLE